MEEVFPVADGITGIDTRMVGKHLVTSAYLVDADEPALIETGPQTSSEAVTAGLAAADIAPTELAHVIVTHIHLDHAGGVGSIAQSFPRATVWVSEHGARHLVDPSRLVASAERIYGLDRLMQWFGSVTPVAVERLRSVSNEDVIHLGNRTLDVLYTPGHASHHIALHDSRTGAVFVGDALGVHLPDVKVLRPATPPPDFDPELACSSIDRIRDRASLLLLSHFGPVAEVDHLCGLAIARIKRWSEDVHEALRIDDDLERIVSLLERRGAQEYLEDSGEEIDLERYDVLSSIRMNATGLVRYWKKRADREAVELANVPLAMPGPPADREPRSEPDPRSEPEPRPDPEPR